MCFKQTFIDPGDSEFKDDLWDDVVIEFGPELDDGTEEAMPEEEPKSEVAKVDSSSRITSRLDSLEEDSKFCTRLDDLWSIVDMIIMGSFCILPIILNFSFAYPPHIPLIGYGVSRKLVHKRLLPRLRHLRHESLLDWRPLLSKTQEKGSINIHGPYFPNCLSKMETRRDNGMFHARLCALHFKWIIVRSVILYVYAFGPILLPIPFLETALLLLAGYGSSRKFIHSELLPNVRKHRNVSLRRWRDLLDEEHRVDDHTESWRPFDFVQHGIIDVEIFILSSRVIFPVQPIIFRVGCALHALFFLYLNGKYALSYSFRMFRGVFRMASRVFRMLRKVYLNVLFMLFVSDVKKSIHKLV